MIQFTCPHCAKAIRLKEEFAGRKGSCPHCKNPIQAPASTPPQSAAPPRPRPARPAPPPRPAEPELAFIDEDDAAVDEPVMVRREKSTKGRKTNPMPLVIGGGAVAGLALISLIVWLVMKPSP